MTAFDDAATVADALRRYRNRQREGLRPFRAEVTGLAAGLVEIQRYGASDDEDAGYPVIIPGAFDVGDEVVAIDLGGAPIVIGRLGTIDDLWRIPGQLRTTGNAPIVAPLAAAGNTATTAGQTAGTDTAGVIELIPSGTGITTGNQLTLTFAETRPDEWFTVHLYPMTTIARTLGMSIGPTGRSASGFSLTSGTALTSGQTYRWSYLVVSYPG